MHSSPPGSRRALLLGGAAVAASAACKEPRGAAASASASSVPAAAPRELGLLNVSYDPTRELYAEYNALFAKSWLARAGQRVSIQQSHGGSATQARAVLDGLEADVVTLALGLDISMLARRAGLLPLDWQARLPFESSPYTSTVVLLVRAGNPTGIRDFADLARPGVGVITPNPKTGGGARWNYLAAWGHAARQPGATPEKVRAFMKRVLKNVAVFDSGARGSTTTFVQRGIGDVLLTWENEAKLAIAKDSARSLELVMPAASILAEPPVAVVDRVVEKHGTRALAEAYLRGLYDADAQELIARHGYRPRDPRILERYRATFPKLELFDVQDVFGGWEKAQAEHFAEGGTYDQLLKS